MNLEFLHLSEGREPRGKTRFPPHLWDKWEGKQLIMRGNFDILTRGLVILVLVVAIYDAGSFYVINQYSSICFLLRNVEDPSSVTLHRLTWLDSDKEEGGVILCRN